MKVWLRSESEKIFFRKFSFRNAREKFLSSD